MKKDILTSVRVTRGTMDKLRSIANREETSVAAIIRKAVVLFLSRKSDRVQ